MLANNTVKKISRCFNEREYPSGKVLIEEGAPLKNIYIIKSGTCEIYSKQNPLKAKEAKDEKFFLKLP